MSTILNFHPAPRPMWVLFSDDEGGTTFALMPGWATSRSDDGFTWTNLTWQNLHNFEADVLDPESHTLIRMWDSGTHPRPALDEVLAALQARPRGATTEELEAASTDYRMWFPTQPTENDRPLAASHDA
ncbi:hypothetical protein [Streptomyces sp. NPDC093260]|uniref:hypothetical protein n=1 Tax=Streptomyces sp. NPDC093260 TaxID=3155073 RepID=UPI00341D58B1